jgi:pimeloyl-ACP methyl ester carboxylesterase
MSAMDRPRLLLVPNLTEIEWLNRPALEEWADVASYDSPGVGDEPPVDDFGSRAIARRGVEEIERRGWGRCFVVADEFGVAAALHLAGTAPEMVQGLALGHARLSNGVDGDRAPINREVHSASSSLIQRDQRAFVHQLFRMTGGERMVGGYGAGMVEEYLRRVPAELMLPFWASRPQEGSDFVETLRALEVPMLLAQHRGCLLFTEEGFDDVVAAFPDAHAVRMEDKPSTSVEFAGVLREFCLQHAAVSA